MDPRNHLLLLALLAGLLAPSSLQAARSESLRPLYDQLFNEQQALEPKRVLILLSQLNELLAGETLEQSELSQADREHVRTLVGACTIRDDHCTGATLAEYERLWALESNANARNYLRHCQSVQLSFCLRFLTAKLKHEAQEIKVRERVDMSQLLKLVYELQPVAGSKPKGAQLARAVDKYLRSKESFRSALSEQKFESKLEAQLLGMCQNFESSLGAVVDELASLAGAANSELKLDELSQNWMNSVRVCRRLADRSNGILQDVYLSLKDRSGPVGLISGCFKATCFDKHYPGDEE